MASLESFAQSIAALKRTPVENAVAFLWYYRQTAAFEERTASELANDLHAQRFPRPNVTRLKRDLRRSRFTIKGRRPGTFQISITKLDELEAEYGQHLGARPAVVSDTIIPKDWTNSRVYLDRMTHQINGCYEQGFYDACGVLLRRLMESLIIETYIHEKRKHEIQANGAFLMLKDILAHARADTKLTLGRNTPKTMADVKELGDTAAHDRTALTSKQDIDDIVARYRKMLQDLLGASGIRK